MFTGIVAAVGRLAAVSQNNGAALRITAPFRAVKKGESIAVNGACLTVERVVKGGFTVQAVGTTLGRTLIGEWQKGQAVNLERALRASDRLGGHFVQGHVDAVGTVDGVTANGDALVVDVRVPREVAETTVLHGSITIDGVSLTVNAILRPGVLQVSLVPFTREHTTLGKLKQGDRVHVEADVLGKYVRQLCRSAQ
ncbi:MAG: riboflavin synthase [Gemmatimonadetes bacterium]|nr:MAG: riboflavin synthase subunit alpha [Gemmatimonadetes bacterium 13_1_20CM_4_66_11]PYP97171.1 MAG: riboflavin synthase [Gemmatimonadota bacterium]